MMSRITLHPTAKRVSGGFVPMITLRGSRGRMVGSRTPKGDARYWRTFDTFEAAQCDAYAVALRVAERIGVRVA